MVVRLPSPGHEGQLQDPSPPGQSPCKPRSGPYLCLPHPPARATAGEAPAAAGCKNTYLLPELRIRSALQRRARAPAPGAPLSAPPPAPSRPRRSLRPSAHPARARAHALSGRRLSRARACALAARSRSRSRVPEAAEGPRGCLGNCDQRGPRVGSHPRRRASGPRGAGDRGQELEAEAGWCGRGRAGACGPTVPPWVRFHTLCCE